MWMNRCKFRTITKHIPRQDDARKFVGHFYSWLEDYCVGEAGETTRSNVLFIEEMGLAGKSAFLQEDVKNALESKNRQGVNVDASLPKPLFIYIDYDALDHVPTETEVLCLIRRSLVGGGIKVPLFDYALWLYGKKTNTQYEEVEAPASKNSPYPDVFRDFVKGVNAAFIEEGFISLQVIKALKPLKDAISSLLGNVDAMLRGDDRALFNLPTSVLLRSLPWLMLRDVRLAMYREHEGLCSQLEPSARGICLCFDAVERRDSDRAWESAFAGSRDIFVVFSGRTIPGNIKEAAEGRSVNFLLSDGSGSGGIASRLLDEYRKELKPDTCDAIEAAIERYEGSVGFASLCITTALQNESSAASLRECLSGYANPAVRSEHGSHDAVFQNLIDDVLDIQLGGLPGDQVQALCVAAWFDPVAPRTICRLLPMIQAHSYAMSRNMALPYITELDGDQSGKLKIHSLVAHCIRLKCDPITIDNAIASLCEGLSREVTTKRTEDERMVLGAICRLQSGRVLQELGEHVDATVTLSLQEVIEGRGALEDWENLVVCALDGYGRDDASSKEVAIKEVSELLRWLLCWNETRRASSDYQEIGLYVDYAKEICKFWTRLISHLNNSENGVGTSVDRVSYEMMQSEALVRCGAMLSDEYRATSKIELHIEALDNELHAFEILLRHPDKVSLKGQCNSLNSLAVSTQRIMHYEYSLSFHKTHHALMKGDANKQISDEERRKYIRNYGAALYSCAHDITTGAVPADCFRPGVELGDEPGAAVTYLVNQACDVLDEAPNDWKAQTTKAECLMLIGDFNGAEGELRGVLQSVEAGGQKDSDYWTRCCRVLARCLSSVDNEAHRSLLEACKYAWLGFTGTVKKHGEHHVDVEKDVKLVGEIKAQMKDDAAFDAIVKENRTDETDRCLNLLKGFDVQEQEVPARVPYQLNERMTERLNRVVNHFEEQCLVEWRAEERMAGAGAV